MCEAAIITASPQWRMIWAPVKRYSVLFGAERNILSFVFSNILWFILKTLDERRSRHDGRGWFWSFADSNEGRTVSRGVPSVRVVFGGQVSDRGEGWRAFRCYRWVMLLWRWSDVTTVAPRELAGHWLVLGWASFVMVEPRRLQEVTSSPAPCSRGRTSSDVLRFCFFLAHLSLLLCVE